MTPDLDCSKNYGGLRAYVPHILTALAFSLVFLGWVIFVPNSETQPVLAATTSTAAQRDAQTLAYYGDGKLKVLQFYANPTETTRPGSRALVCYGVSNAESVTIEPSLGETWPSTGRCLEATPAKDTEYTLRARDNAGHEQVQTVTLRVQR
ncbi:conserved exported hypothetical protein [Candidatus Sulfopaludibacter sp. SbA3]|nr:conserved exported hypothetical protein [Candidatus Sulfopaludibacter sp. SbA3]